MTEPKSESQYKINATPVATQLPDEFINRAMALQEQAPGGGCLWLARGQLLCEYVNGARNGLRMIIYQKAADVWGVGLSTVREDYRNVSEVGDFASEMPFNVSREQIRCARTEARVKKSDVLVILQERVNESDKFGGQLCPPRVWKVQIKDMKNGKHDDGNDVVGRIRGASSALTTAMKRAARNEKYAAIMEDLKVVNAAVDDLLDKAERIKE